MKKRFYLLFTFMFIFGIIVGGCSTMASNAKQDYPLKIYLQNENGSMSTYNVVDEDTGVNYIVVSHDLYQQPTVTMCPRYNADGSLYVEK